MSQKAKTSFFNRLFQYENQHYITFIIAAVSATIAFYFAEILPGQQWVDLGDAYTQPAAFSRLFVRHMFEGADMFYSHEVSLGQNTALIYAMYGYSPFSVFYLLPFDTYTILIITNILRVAFAAAFFELFLRRGLNLHGRYTIAFSLCYSLSSFHIFFLNSANFAEGVYLFPLLMWILLRSIKKKKYTALCLCYVLCFVSNFYAGYIIGLSSFAALLIYLFLHSGIHFIKQNFSLLMHYTFAVITALAISMIVLFPAFFFYFNIMAGSFNGNFLSSVSPITLFSGLFWGEHNRVMDEYTSLYAGTPVLMLMMLYFFNPKFALKERLIMLLALFSFVAAYYIDPLYLALHAFNPPTGYPMRFAYVYISLIVVLAAKQYSQADTTIMKTSHGQFTILGIYISIAAILLIIGRKADYITVLINIILIIIWTIYLLIIKNNFSNIIASLLGLLFIATELCCGISLGYLDDTPANSYRYYTSQLPELIETIQSEQKDGQLYRARISNILSTNLPSEYGINGSGIFSTGIYPALQVFFLRMGDNINGYAYSMEGLTELTEMILGIQYQARLDSLESAYGNDLYYYNKNELCLPIGFSVSEKLLSMPPLGIDPFQNQNNIISSMIGKQNDVYIPAQIPDLESRDMSSYYLDKDSLFMQRESNAAPGMAIFTIPKKEYEHAYFMLSNTDTIGTPTERLSEPDEELLSIYSERDRYSNGIRGSACASATKGITEMSISDDLFYILLLNNKHPEIQTIINHVYTYYQDDSALLSAFKTLSANGWIIDSYDSRHINASVTIPEDRRVLFISIPYDPGWNCTIDGTDVEVLKVIDDTFMAIKVSPGTHNIKLTYTVPGLKEGFICFCIGIALLLFMIINEKSIKPNIQTDDADHS